MERWKQAGGRVDPINQTDQSGEEPILRDLRTLQSTGESDENDTADQERDNVGCCKPVRGLFGPENEDFIDQPGGKSETVENDPAGNKRNSLINGGV